MLLIRLTYCIFRFKRLVLKWCYLNLAVRELLRKRYVQNQLTHDLIFSLLISGVGFFIYLFLFLVRLFCFCLDVVVF